MRALFTLLFAGCPAAGPDTAEEGCGPLAVSADGGALLVSGAGCAAAELHARAVGDGDLTVSLAVEGGVVVPTVTAGPAGATLRALALEGQGEVDGAEPLRWWRQGYQSWSWAGVVEAAAVSLDDAGLPLVGGAAEAASFLADDPATSWWAGLLGRPGGGSLLLGALGATRVPFYTAADAEGALFAVWGGFGEGYVLAPGESLDLDPLWIGASRDPGGLWEAWAAAVAERAPARVPAAPPALGWSSWYAFYAGVSEDDVRANVARAVALREEGLLPALDLLQVDDGWERAWGDWTANDRFPSGMAALAAEIEAAGMRPGLWLAPFYVGRATPAYLEHPGWWVRDAAGAELTFDNDGPESYAMLDVTEPEAAAWLTEVIAARVAEGWTYLKLDFLYAGAQPGQRHEPVSGLQAYHRGIALLREAAGEGTFILACGAPMLPSVGFADGFRTGADIAYGWSPDPEPAYLRWQARATAGRAFANGLWWWNDPDVLLVREPFSLAQARGAVAAQVVSGGLWLLGDDLAALPDERLALALHPDATALRGARVRPLDPLAYTSGHDLGPVAERQVPDDRVPFAWELSGGVRALLDLGDEPAAVAGPGGVEVLTGVEAAPGVPRALAPGVGEVWAP